MSVCPLSRYVTPVVLAVALAAGIARGQAPAPTGRLVQKVYSVADLVIPIPGTTACPAPACVPAPVAPMPPATTMAVPVAPGAPPFIRVGLDCAAAVPPRPLPACPAASWAPMPAATRPTEPAPCPDVLIKLIQNSIAPPSWAAMGGHGTVEYMPIGHALVVCQTADVHEQVAELLDALRRLQDVQVVMEVRVLTVGDDAFAAIADAHDLRRRTSTVVGDDTLRHLMDQVQEDRFANVLQAPKVTTLDGQEATICCTEQRFFVTGLNVTHAGGQAVFVPQNEPVADGLRMTVRPTVTPDRRGVIVKLDAELTELAEPADVPLFPVTTFITPVFEGGAQGQPVPFTQFIQQPTFVKRGVAKVIGVPDGRTAVLYAGRRPHTHTQVDYAPILGDIPVVGELFKATTEYEVGNHLLLTVTPRVIVTAEGQNAVMAPAAAVKQADHREPCPAPAACPASCVKDGGKCCTQAAPPPCCAEKCVPAPAAKACEATKACPVPCAPEALPAPMPGVACDVLMTRPCPPPVPPPPPVPQVQLDVTLALVDESYFDRPEAAAWRDLSPKACGQPKLLDAAEGKRFALFIQSMRHHRAAKILAEPKLVTRHGTPATYLSGGEQVVPEVAQTGGIAGIRFEPYGTQVSYVPTVRGDGRIHLEIEASVSQLNRAHGYTAGGVRVAGRDEHRVQTSVEMRPGQSHVMYVGRGNADGHRLVMLVTPHLVDPYTGVTVPEPEEQSAREPAADPKLAKLLAKYHKACADGRPEAARRLAGKCLAIDPTCFSRDR
jgi:Flp pilus assembly secretin CpaC